MKVAIITPYFKEPEATLQRCLSSVQAQDYAAVHILVADGHPQPFIDNAGVRHVQLDRAHADAGNTARGIGALLAVAEEFDAISFLDADNWFEPQHVSACIATAMATPLVPDFVVARRRLVRPDGSELLEARVEDESTQHVDTNCLFLLRGSFYTAPRWALLPKALYDVGDRVYLRLLIAEGLRASRCPEVTVNYSCTWRSPYLAANEEPPADAKPDPDPAHFAQWWRALNASERVVASRLVGFPLVKAAKM